MPIILSQPGVKYFLSEKLGQDLLEKFFGCLHQQRKVNGNPMLNELYKGTQALRVLGDINVKAITGNCRRKKRSANHPAVNDSQLKKGRKIIKKTYNKCIKH